MYLMLFLKKEEEKRKKGTQPFKHYTFISNKTCCIKQQKTFKRVLDLKNVYEIPKIRQVVVSSGFNGLRADAASVAKDVSMITGLKPMIVIAKLRLQDSRYERVRL
ncbi:MAG: hypothetical protein ACKFIZ_00550 [Candidatus Hodgkinia cicadicola]